jgi:hypothetical protein
MHSDNDEEVPDSINIIIIIIVGDDHDRGSRFLGMLGHMYQATLHPIPEDGLPSLSPV